MINQYKLVTIDFGNDNHIIVDSPTLETVCWMIEEYYSGCHTVFSPFLPVDHPCDIGELRIRYPLCKIIYYNLEHRCFVKDNGRAEDPMDFIAGCDELWDFNIEDYFYFQSYGLGDKFRFMPLRYMSRVAEYQRESVPRYDIQFEGTFDTKIRYNFIHCLSNIWYEGDNWFRLNLKITNTSDINTRFEEKQDAICCMDCPHWDVPQTINIVRIFECLSLNRPVIVYDPYKIGSYKYVNDMVVFRDDLNVLGIYKTIHDSGLIENPAQILKEKTFSNKEYERYRMGIFNDFNKIVGNSIPMSVLNAHF